MTDIAIFLMDLGGGGAERVMINLGQGFAEGNLKVDLVLVKAEGPYLPQLDPQINVIALDKPRLIFSLPSLVNYLKQKQPKILLSALEDTNFVALVARKLAGVSTQVAVTVHNHLSRESKNSTQLKRRLTPNLVRLLYPMADYVIGVSKGVADNLIELGVCPDKTHFIYNPIVSSELFKKLQEPVDHPAFSSGQPPVILGVGRLTKQKDFSTLVQAFAIVRQQREARLMILGQGSEKAELERLIQQLGLTEDILFPGFVPNPYAYMAHSAVLVLSSAWEGFGNVLVEAMAAGTPVVSTNCESGPAEILANGEYGQLVPVGNAQALADAINMTLDQPMEPERLRQRANLFSLQQSVNQYQALFKLSPNKN